MSAVRSLTGVNRTWGEPPNSVEIDAHNRHGGAPLGRIGLSATGKAIRTKVKGPNARRVTHTLIDFALRKPRIPDGERLYEAKEPDVATAEWKEKCGCTRKMWLHT